LLLAGALVAGGVGAGLGVAFAPNSTNNALQEPLGSTSPTTSTPSPSGALSTAVITRLVSPAVVDINTVVATESGQPQQEAAGTGMIVSSNGVILTNNHVIEDAQKITVVIGGKSHPATVLGTAKSSDVALLKVSGVSGLPTVSLGDSTSVAVGDSVVAIGNALGLGGSPSSAPGYISKTGATISASSEGDTDETETLSGMFQTNAEIQPGDSGGPLVNGKGQVIGMDTAALSSDSGSTVGFAIPIATARAIALKIENHQGGNGIVLGLSPYLGIFYTPGSQSSSSTNPLNGGYSIGSGLGTTTCANGTTGNSGTTTNGITLSGVASSGPAAAAGLVSGDVVTSIAGHATTSQSQLTNAVSGLKPGQHVAVDYTDSCGTAHTTSLTLGGIPD
jgi:S1-C subfamily serine protease